MQISALTAHCSTCWTGGACLARLSPLRNSRALLVMALSSLLRDPPWKHRTLPAPLTCGRLERSSDGLDWCAGVSDGHLYVCWQTGNVWSGLFITIINTQLVLLMVTMAFTTVFPAILPSYNVLYAGLSCVLLCTLHCTLPLSATVRSVALFFISLVHYPPFSIACLCACPCVMYISFSSAIFLWLWSFCLWVLELGGGGCRFSGLVF